MVSTTLSMVAFFALIAWRFVFKGLRPKPLAREITAPRQQHANALEQGLHILDPARVAVIPDYRFENGSDGVPITPKDRAESCLHRIVALTGATKTSQGYVLDVGTTRFFVRDGYVRRQRDASDPKCGCERTCFSLPYNRMPKEEQIATALLQLRNNPALFDRWAAQCGAYKADGQVFTRAQ